ncbi:MAG: hypothetical protein ACI9ES_002966 [Oceanospirillaceae bacterium]
MIACGSFLKDLTCWLEVRARNCFLTDAGKELLKLKLVWSLSIIMVHLPGE